MKRVTVIVIVLFLAASTFYVIAESKKANTVNESISSTEARGSLAGNENSSPQYAGEQKTIQETEVNQIQYAEPELPWPEPRRVIYEMSELNTLISGKVMLPEGKKAPEGGIKVYIEAGINPNTMSYEILRSGWPISINKVEIIIPEGSSSAPYEIPVVNYYKMDDKEFEPWYALMFYYSTEKKDPKSGQYKGPLDISQGDQKNIDYILEY